MSNAPFASMSNPQGRGSEQSQWAGSDSWNSPRNTDRNNDSNQNRSDWTGQNNNWNGQNGQNNRNREEDGALPWSARGDPAADRYGGDRYAGDMSARGQSTFSPGGGARAGGGPGTDTLNSNCLGLITDIIQVVNNTNFTSRENISTSLFNYIVLILV
jgi:hypothetical protein